MTTTATTITANYIRPMADTLEALINQIARQLIAEGVNEIEATKAAFTAVMEKVA